MSHFWGKPLQLNLKRFSAGVLKDASPLGWGAGRPKFSGCPTPADSHFLSGSSIKWLAQLHRRLSMSSPVTPAKRSYLEVAKTPPKPKEEPVVSRALKDISEWQRNIQNGTPMSSPRYSSRQPTPQPAPDSPQEIVFARDLRRVKGN